MNTRDYSTQSLKRQRRRLADWLVEWRMQQMLASTVEPDGADEPSRAAVTDAGKAHEPFAVPLQVPLGAATALSAGQIRLMAPDGEGSRDAPRYILMLTQLASARWLAVPFGRFSVPALPGEWQTGLRTLAVRVLSIWNTRETSSQRMRNSWYVRRLDAARWRQALRLTADCFLLADTLRSLLVRQAAGQSAPPSPLGPPLLHPLDPRHEYLNEETVAMDTLGSPAGRVQGNVCWRGDPIPGVGCAMSLQYPVGGDSAYLKAAERGSEYLGSDDLSGE